MSCFCSIVLLVLPLLVSEVNSEDKSAASSASKPAEEQDFSASKPAEEQDLSARKPAEEQDYSARKPAEEQDFSAAKTLDAEINAKEGKRSL